MLTSTCNNRGFTLIEVLIALFIISAGIMAVMSMQPMAWLTAGKADVLGRAAEILQQEISSTELAIMNPNNAVTTGQVETSVHTSGGTSAQMGDFSFTVRTNTTDNGDGSWTVRVTVIWPSGNKSISESILVTRQEGFRM